MLKNLKKVAAIVLSFAMAVQFGLADSYYVNAVEEPVEPQQEETTTTAPQEQEEVPTTEEETPQQQEEQQQLLITKLIANTVFKLNCTHN